MGTKTTVAATVPASTHIAAAELVGRNPTVMQLQLQAMVNDVITMAKQIVKDMTAGNASDPNIATYNTLITNLS